MGVLGLADCQFQGKLGLDDLYSGATRFSFQWDLPFASLASPSGQYVQVYPCLIWHFELTSTSWELQTIPMSLHVGEHCGYLGGVGRWSGVEVMVMVVNDIGDGVRW